METVDLVLALFLAVAAFGALGRWLPIPLPMILVLGGAALSFVPALSHVRLDPDVFFLLLVPPLLFSDGWAFPKREFLANLRPIMLLAFGLVAVTVVVVGYAMHWLVPSLPLAAAFALGAIVSPTDALATTSITERLSVPSKITHILNGESLINDASGLVAFRFAVAAVATGTFSWLEAGGQLVLLAVGGTLLGLAIAYAIGELRVRMMRYCIDDPTIQTILSLLTPYAAYLAAEMLHVFEVWDMVLYVFNGLAFLLLGLQLRSVLVSLDGVSGWQLAGWSLALYAIVNLVRIAWVYPGTYLPLILFPATRRREGWRNPRGVFLVGWAGIRGTVTLAAALSVPYFTAGGDAFPARDLIVFLAAS